MRNADNKAVQFSSFIDVLKDDFDSQTAPSQSGGSGDSVSTTSINKNYFKSDNTVVGWSRLLVFLVLGTAAALLGYLTYYYVEQEEMEDFRTEVSCLGTNIVFTCICLNALIFLN